MAFRWAKAGIEVLIGSRQIEKAQTAAEEVNQLIGKSGIKVIGCGESKLPQKKQISLFLQFLLNFTFQCSNQLKISIKGKILIDVTVPLVPPKVTKVQMPPAGSAALEAKSIVDESTEVVVAFKISPMSGYLLMRILIVTSW